MTVFQLTPIPQNIAGSILSARATSIGFFQFSGAIDDFVVFNLRRVNRNELAIRLWGAQVLLTQLREEPKCVQGGTEKNINEAFSYGVFQLEAFQNVERKSLGPYLFGDGDSWTFSPLRICYHYPYCCRLRIVELDSYGSPPLLFLPGQLFFQSSPKGKL